MEEMQWVLVKTLGSVGLQSVWRLHLKRTVTTQFQLTVAMGNMGPVCQPHYFFRMTWESTFCCQIS